VIAMAIMVRKSERVPLFAKQGNGRLSGARQARRGRGNLASAKLSVTESCA